MESDRSHGQSTAAASSDHSNWEQQQSGAEPGSSGDDSSEQEESDAESEEEWQQGKSTQGQRGPRAGGERAAHPPAAAAQEQPIRALHAPHSHMLWCDSQVQARCRLQVANSLCTDIADVSSCSGSGTAAVQVTVEVHAASWDVRQYILSQLQQQAPAGQQQGQQSVQAGSSTPGPKVFGPYAATLIQNKSNKHLFITQLQHQHKPQTYLQHLAGKPHRVALQERVPGSDPPHFKLHLKPGTPDKTRNQHGKAISRAGEGPGLQVAPGSVSEVANPGALSRNGSKTRLIIPKVLLCSQLPADTTYPLDISLRVLPPPAGQQGQWTARIYPAGSNSWRVHLGLNHPLSAYVGRSISKMSLSQDRQLTLTFAPTPTAPAAPAAPAVPPSAAAAAAEVDAAPAAPQHVAAAAAGAAAAAAAPNAGLQAAHEEPQPRLSLKRPAAGSPAGQQQQHQQPGVQVTGSEAAAAATAGGTSVQAAAAVTRKKPRRGSQQQQQQQQQQQATAMAAAAAAAATLLRSAPVSVKQEGGGVQSHTAAGNISQAAAAARRQASDDDITTAAGMPAVPIPTIKQEAATQEVLDLTADSDEGGSPAAAAAAVAPAAAAAASADPAALAAGLQLPPASTPAEIERALLGLMTATLLPLLPRETYVNLMMRLRELFEPMKRGAVAAGWLEQLQSNYAYVQAAVYGGQLRDVVAALGGLDAVWVEIVCGFNV